MRSNNSWVTIFIIIAVLFMISPLISWLLFTVVPLLLLAIVVWYAYVSFKAKKIYDKQQKQQENQNIYDNFYENKAIDDQPFDKDKFFEESQDSDLGIIDAKVVDVVEKEDE